MKQFILLIGVLFAIGGRQLLSAQQKTSAQPASGKPAADKPASGKPAADKQNMEITTEDAFYPAGEQELYDYVLYNTKYTEEAKKHNVEGTIRLGFDVMPDSTIQNVKIFSDAGYGVAQAVKSLVEKLKFAPAVMMGTKVKTNLIMDFPVKAH